MHLSHKLIVAYGLWLLNCIAKAPNKLHMSIVACKWIFSRSVSTEYCTKFAYSLYSSPILLLNFFFSLLHQRHFLFVYPFVCVIFFYMQFGNGKFVAMECVWECIVKCYEINSEFHGKNHLILIDTFIIADIIYSFIRILLDFYTKSCPPKQKKKTTTHTPKWKKAHIWLM